MNHNPPTITGKWNTWCWCVTGSPRDYVLATASLLKIDLMFLCDYYRHFPVFKMCSFIPRLSPLRRVSTRKRGYTSWGNEATKCACMTHTKKKHGYCTTWLFSILSQFYSKWDCLFVCLFVCLWGIGSMIQTTQYHMWANHPTKTQIILLIGLHSVIVSGCASFMLVVYACLKLIHTHIHMQDCISGRYH